VGAALRPGHRAGGTVSSCQHRQTKGKAASHATPVCFSPSTPHWTPGTLHLDEERRVAAELQAEGILKQLYRRSHGPGVFIIVEANDLDDAHKQMGRLPLVACGLLTLEFVEVDET
jgi:hypothetical protein